MKLNEVVSNDSYVQWFLTGYKEALDRGFAIAQSTWNSTENPKLTRMHSGAAVSKWAADNLINTKGYSITGLLKALGASNLMPNIPGTGRDREDSGFSYGSMLHDIIENLKPYMEKAGYGQQHARLLQLRKEHTIRMSRLFVSDDDDGGNSHNEPPAPPKEDPNSQAHAMINQVISSLPKDHQGRAREYISRRGFTLQALKQYIDQAGIKM